MMTVDVKVPSEMDSSYKSHLEGDDGVKIRHVVNSVGLEEQTTIQMDSPCHNCVTLCSGDICTNNHTDTAQLLKYSDVPRFMRGNPFIRSGYRSTLSVPHCVKSIIQWNNETVNVWSHLLGAVLFVILIFYDNVIAIPSLKGSLVDHIILTLALMCFTFSLVCSAAYHTFYCHSERSCRRWLAMDLTGISVGLIGCYLPAVHYAYYCLSVWRDIYLIVISMLLGAVLMCQTTPQYVSNSWFYRRMFLFLSLAAYGIIPTIHWIILNGGLGSHIVQVFLPKVTIMYTLGCMAFFFYITKFPERLFPGRFDYIGSSHQLWHVTVVVAFLWWHVAGREILAFRIAEPCDT